jgi:hypothetical protein
VTPSDGLLRRLTRIPPTAAFVLVLAVLLAGLLLPGIVGAALLTLLGLGLVGLTAVTWRVQPPATRVLRVIILALLFAAALAKVITS